jgi:hypothetical protein
MILRLKELAPANEIMKAKSKISFIPLIYGIIITSLMLLIFGSTLFFSLLENWPGEIKEILQALVKWYDDPTGFFFTYITGYIVIWRKPLPGSVIIMLGSILIFVINIYNPGFLIFAVPTFLVGFFYLESWHLIRKKNKAVSI